MDVQVIIKKKVNYNSYKYFFEKIKSKVYFLYLTEYKNI